MKVKKQLCEPHRNGVLPGYPPFFNAGCATCEAKKAAGKVTGDEGPLGKRRFNGLPVGPSRSAPRSGGTGAGAPRSASRNKGT